MSDSYELPKTSTPEKNIRDAASQAGSIVVGREVEIPDKKKLEDVFEVLADERYVVWGHGTSSQEVARRIMFEGLVAHHDDLSSTARPIDFDDVDGSRNNLNNWSHHKAKDVVLLRLPIRFMSKHTVGDMIPTSFSSDLPGGALFEDDGLGFFRDRSFCADQEEYVMWDKRFIYGTYDVRTGTVTLNPGYLNLDDPKSLEKIDKEFEAYEFAHNNHILNQDDIEEPTLSKREGDRVIPPSDADDVW